MIGENHEHHQRARFRIPMRGYEHDERKRFAYFLQAGTAGASETFAEGVRSLVVKSGHLDDFGDKFPESMKFIEKLLQ